MDLEILQVQQIMFARGMRLKILKGVTFPHSLGNFVSICNQFLDLETMVTSIKSWD